MLYIKSCRNFEVSQTDLLHQRHNDDEGAGHEPPDPTEDRPSVEAVKLQDVDAEHRPRPDENEECGEGQTGAVGRQLGSPELLDDDLQGGTVVEVRALRQIQLTLWSHHA